MLKSAAQQASRSKWKWAGHVARLHHTRWAQAHVGPLRQEKQRQAKHQMGRLFQQTSGTTVARDRNEWKVLENQLNVVNHSR